MLAVERRRLQHAQDTDRVVLDAMALTPATGSMAHYERARRDVLLEDIAHRDAQLRWIASRLGKRAGLPLSATAC